MIKDLFVSCFANYRGSAPGSLGRNGTYRESSTSGNERFPAQKHQGQAKKKTTKKKLSHDHRALISRITFTDITRKETSTSVQKQIFLRPLVIIQLYQSGAKKTKRKCSNDLSGLRPADCGFCGSNTVPPDFIDLKLTSVWRSPK